MDQEMLPWLPRLTMDTPPGLCDVWSGATEVWYLVIYSFIYFATFLRVAIVLCCTVMTFYKAFIFYPPNFSRYQIFLYSKKASGNCPKQHQPP